MKIEKELIIKGKKKPIYSAVSVLAQTIRAKKGTHQTDTTNTLGYIYIYSN